MDDQKFANNCWIELLEETLNISSNDITVPVPILAVFALDLLSICIFPEFDPSGQDHKYMHNFWHNYNIVSLKYKFSLQSLVTHFLYFAHLKLTVHYFICNRWHSLYVVVP